MIASVVVLILAQLHAVEVSCPSGLCNQAPPSRGERGLRIDNTPSVDVMVCVPDGLFVVDGIGLIEIWLRKPSGSWIEMEQERTRPESTKCKSWSYTVEMLEPGIGWELSVRPRNLRIASKVNKLKIVYSKILGDAETPPDAGAMIPDASGTSVASQYVDILRYGKL